MNYSLAKRLKDAGFPQAKDDKGTLRQEGSYLFPEGTNLSLSQKKLTKLIAYAPSLPELIEACGEDFVSLVNGGGAWFANAVDKRVESGVTPEEAVAELWISLNNK